MVGSKVCVVHMINDVPSTPTRPDARARVDRARLSEKDESVMTILLTVASQHIRRSPLIGMALTRYARRIY